MNIIRSILASLLIAVFVSLAAATALAESAMFALRAESVDRALGSARLGERLTPLVLAQIPPLPANLPLKPKGFAAAELFAEAIPPAQVESAVKASAEDAVAFVRGEHSEVKPIDVAAFANGMKTALGKHLSAPLASAASKGFQSALSERGLDKGIAIPVDQLSRAREIYGQASAGILLAIHALVVLFALILAIAPGGLRGRLKRAGTALLSAAGTVAATAFALPYALEKALAASGGVPPEALAIAKAVLGSLFSSVSRWSYIFAGAAALLGLVFLVAMALVGKAAAGKQAASTRPSTLGFE